MPIFFRRMLLLSLLTVSSFAAMSARPDGHNHGQDKEPVERPKVFLDKSRRVVEYQLKRLDNQRLLMVERSTDDKKYVPVYAAILSRAGVSPQYREEASIALAKLNGTSVTAELLEALGVLKSSRQDLRTAKQLNKMLFDQPAFEIGKQAAAFEAATSGRNQLQRAAGYAGLITGGAADKAWSKTNGEESALLDWLSAVASVPDASALREQIVDLVSNSESADVRNAAIEAVSFVKSQQGETFKLLAPLVQNNELRDAAVVSLNAIPVKSYDTETARDLVGFLVKHAEETPAAKRTSDNFLNAMQLADRLFARVPADRAKVFRERLGAVTVRVVRIHTIEEEMRYDKTFFVVEAGRPVQIVLENEDLMPHNLVITSPGKLKDVALEGAALGTTPGKEQKLYVPESNDVLFASTLVNAGQREILTFTAPTEPGEYPYVCTFPRHWMRMYGVMLVVPDLDEWNRNPVEPKDPLGNTRSFVKSWTLNDFRQEEFDQRLYGRLESSGAKLFKEATCLGCHKMKGEGGAVGPELTDLMKRWKGNKHAVLREILEPSYQIDPKYAQKIVLDDDGKQTVGIVVAEDKKSISLLENAEAKEPTVIQKDNIDEIIASPTSLMPKALMDKFTEDEILDLLNYITQAE